MKWKKRAVVTYLVWVLLPVLLWSGIVFIYGDKHGAISTQFYALYVFVLTLYYSLRQGLTWYYPIGLFILMLIWFLWVGISMVWQTQAAQDQNDVGQLLVTTFMQLYLLSMMVECIGASLLGTLLAKIIRSVQSLKK